MIDKPFFNYTTGIITIIIKIRFDTHVNFNFSPVTYKSVKCESHPKTNT